MSSLTLENLNKEDFINDCLAEALILLMKEKPYDQIGIKELAMKAGIGRATFYRRFDSKDALLTYKIARLVIDWWVSIYDREQESSEYTVEMLQFILDNKSFFRLLDRRDKLNLFINYLSDSAGPAPGDDGPTAYKKLIRLYAFYGLLREWIRQGYKESPQVLADVLLESMAGIKEGDYHDLWSAISEIKG